MDWLFISEAQKNAYNAYKAAYDNAKGLLSDGSLSGLRDDEPELFEALEQVLLETTNTNYTTSAEDTQKLIDAYNNIKNRPSINRTITSVNYGTVCLPWNAWVPAGVTVYAAETYTDKGDTRYVTLQEYTNPQGNNGKNVIPANTGFIIYSTTPKTYTFKYRIISSAAIQSRTQSLRATTKAVSMVLQIRVRDLDSITSILVRILQPTALTSY